MNYITQKFNIKRIGRKILFFVARSFPFIPGKVRALIFLLGGVKFKRFQTNFVGYNVHFDDINPNLITIGENTFITEGCKILTHFVDVTYPDFNHHYTGKVDIGKDVFIGLNVIITKPISIGEGSVIGSGSVLTKNVDPYTIVAGNPAKVIKMRIIKK